LKKIAFQKWEATGNDFLFIDAQHQGVSATDLSARQVVEVCDRETGCGADGVVLYSHSNQSARMTIINSDGSMGDMCGNALRCLAQILTAATGQVEQRVELRNRSVTVRSVGAGRGSVLMGSAEPEGSRALLESLDELDDAMGGQGHLLSFGNPHYVVPFDRIPQDWERRGQICQGVADKLLQTGGINCGFLETRAQDGVFQLRVFERGAGATESCGSGACAASAVLERVSGQEPPHRLALTGGILEIAREGPQFVLSGPVRKEYEGVWKL
jgi:diaminopimelate epimerase